MRRPERRRRARAMADRLSEQLTVPVRVETRRAWAVTLAAWFARVPPRARWSRFQVLRAAICTRLVRLAQYRVGDGAWQCVPYQVTSS